MSLYDHITQESSPDNDYDVEFISFAGAGVNGLVYAGVMKSLEDRGLTKSVKYWIGTSAGSIVASMAALGATQQFIYQIMADTDISTFIDTEVLSSSLWSKIKGVYSVTELFTRLGLSRGDKFNEWIKSCIKKLGFNPNLTFSQLYELTGNHLVIVTSSLNTYETLYLSRSSVPNMHISDAIHVSMIIPYLFQPVVMKDELHDRLLVDGAIMCNDPISAADVQDPSGKLIGINRKCIGFFTKINGLWGPNYEVVDNFMIFSKVIINAMIIQQQRLNSYQPYFSDRCVPIETFGNDGIDFNIKTETKRILFESGYSSCESFLQRRFDMIKENGHLPGNLFIPIVQHQTSDTYQYVKIPGSHGWIVPLSNDSLRDTMVYLINFDMCKTRKIVPH